MSSKGSRVSIRLLTSENYGQLSVEEMDILKTVLEPTLNELAILGGIVVLRTILSVFLNREIKDLEAESEKDQ